MWPHLFPLLLLLLLLVRTIVWKQDQTVRLVEKVCRFNLVFMIAGGKVSGFIARIVYTTKHCEFNNNPIPLEVFT